MARGVCTFLMVGSQTMMIKLQWLRVVALVCSAIAVVSCSSSIQHTHPESRDLVKTASGHARSDSTWRQPSDDSEDILDFTEMGNPLASHCKIHNTLLQKEQVPILYGLRLLEGGYRCPVKYWQFGRTSVDGGCRVQKAKAAIIQVCEKCRIECKKQ